jgi:hypothetical protein
MINTLEKLICDMIINKLFTWLTNKVQAMELQLFNKY